MLLKNQLNKFLPCIKISQSTFLSPLSFLKTNLIFLKKNIFYQFSSLQTIIGIDYVNTTYRFSIVYQIYSFTNKQHLNLKVFFTNKTKIPSITPIFINANWFEREIWDLFGVFFKNHPDLRRILTDYTFEGHPLRKDFPLPGFFETNFLEQKGGLVWNKLNLAQKPKF